MPARIDTDHLVVGAGAMGMAFVDSLVEHADVHVTLVDRRAAPGGHWLDAYDFVQLHQASVFYGVASTKLGDGRLQVDGPEAGLHERAAVPQILAYYRDVLTRLVASGRVTFLGASNFEHRDDEHVVVPLADGPEVHVNVRRRVVDAAWLSPTIPATTPPPFEVDADARVVPVNDLPLVEDAGCHVIVGSGKTATDAIVWLLQHGSAPDEIVWVRPRDPWMLDRARVQPDPIVALDLAIDLFECASRAASLEEVFLRLEEAQVLVRIDPNVFPTMARTPTLGRWELELLRRVDRVVRLGHVRRASRTELTMDEGRVPIETDTVVVHCAASGIVNPPMVPVWSPDRVRLQTSRTGAPCFNAALLGYVEATRDDDVERNRLCPPNLYGNSLAEWARMQARGARASSIQNAESDIAAWANACLLNPSRVDPTRQNESEVQARLEQLQTVASTGADRLAALSG